LGVSASRVGLLFGILLGILISTTGLVGPEAPPPNEEICGPGSTFSLTGYTYNITKDPINGTNVTVEVYEFGPVGPQLNSSYSNLSNELGHFNISGIIGNPELNYKITVRKFNSSDSNKVDYIGQLLPDFPCFEVATLGSVNFYLKEAVTINLTAIGEEQQLDNMVVGESSPIRPPNYDYNVGLEWMGENGTWAYLNTSWYVVLLNSDFTFNSSTTQPVMVNPTAFNYNGGGIFIAANTTTISVFDLNSEINTYDISWRNYTNVTGIEYHSGLFYISGAYHNTTPPVGPPTVAIDVYNSSFNLLSSISIGPLGHLIRYSGRWYLAYYDPEEILALTEYSDSWEPLWQWTFNKPVGGIAHNGSSWYYASLDNNITSFTITDKGIKSFQYYVKDVKLGYPVAEHFGSLLQQAYIHLPADRNYSIEMFPDRAMPVSFDLNNISDYGPSPKIDVEFNITERMIWVSGYVNYNGGYNFSEIKVIPYLLEPGGMVFSDYPMPHDMSAWRTPWGTKSDEYNAGIGFYNITLIGSAMGADIMLFVTARNGTDYYGAFQNITLYSYSEDVTDLNLTLLPLLGNVSNISMSNSTDFSKKVNITTKMKSFKLQNTTGGTPNFAFIEFSVDYTLYFPNATSFSWMSVIQQAAAGIFSLPVISADVKQINIFSPDFAPKKTSLKASDLTSDPVIITLKSFSPGAIEPEEAFTDLRIGMFKSTPECNVPYPNGSLCSLLPAEKNLTEFNPLTVIIGGGDISFRMKQVSTNITVHYNKVDLLASGPPDALFDSNSTERTIVDGAVAEAWRFGSSGPEIYESVLIGVPYNKSLHLPTDNFSVRIKYFYDEDWNVIWNISKNTTAQIPSDYRVYLTDKYNAYVNISKPAMQCSKTNMTSTCYADTTAGMIWIQIPHFSGVAPEISGEDAVPPTITLLSQNQTFLNSSINLSFVATDTQSTTISYNLTINGAVNKTGTTTSGATKTVIVSSLADGVYEWNVTVWDAANNVNTSETRNFTVLTQVVLTPITLQPIDNTTNASGFIDFATQGVPQLMIEQLGITGYEYLITTNGTTPVVNLSVNLYVEAPSDVGDISNLSGAITGIYYRIEVNDSAWYSNVTNIQLRIYYNTSNINLPSNVEESSLRPARYTNGSWIRLDCSSLGGCTTTLADGTKLYAAGVVTSSQNATHPYVWANLSNFSVYGMSGSIVTPTVAAPSVAAGAYIPQVIVLANDIDYNLSSSFFGFLRNRGISLTRVTAAEFSKYKNSRFIIILGGPDAYEGVGDIVKEILDDAEEAFLRVPGNRKMYTRTNVWSTGQVVRVIAGSGRDQTKAEADENKADVSYRIKYHPVH
jgi:hypothetical protein